MADQSTAAGSSDAGAAAPKKPPGPPKKGFKLVLLGDAAVGKSSILMRFLQNKFTDGIETTVGAAFSTKTIETRSRQVKFEIWDTAGQERFKSLAPMYYRGASSAMVVYDQTNMATFERAQEWVRQVSQTAANPNIVVALVGNKMDLADQRQVPVETAEAFAEREGLLFQETSARTGKNVAGVFEMIASHLPDEPFVPDTGRGLVVSSTLNQQASGSGGGAEPQRAKCCMQQGG
jgi:Ras-related protein Rab-5C